MGDRFSTAMKNRPELNMRRKIALIAAAVVAVIGFALIISGGVQLSNCHDVYSGYDGYYDGGRYYGGYARAVNKACREGPIGQLASGVVLFFLAGLIASGAFCLPGPDCLWGPNESQPASTWAPPASVPAAHPAQNNV
jgi:hypothetical protein